MCLSVHCDAAAPRSEMNPCRLLYREVCDGGRSHKILQAPLLQEQKILPQRRKTSAADGLRTSKIAAAFERCEGPPRTSPPPNRLSHQSNERSGQNLAPPKYRRKIPPP